MNDKRQRRIRRQYAVHRIGRCIRRIVGIVAGPEGHDWVVNRVAEISQAPAFVVPRIVGQVQYLGRTVSGRANRNGEREHREYDSQ